MNSKVVAIDGGQKPRLTSVSRLTGKTQGDVLCIHREAKTATALSCSVQAATAMTAFPRSTASTGIINAPWRAVRNALNFSLETMMTQSTNRRFSVWPLACSFVCGIITTLLATQFVAGSKSISNGPEGNIVLSKVNESALGDRFIGSWMVDRPDTQQDERETITFSANGAFDDAAADTFSKQWFCTDGMLYVIARPNDMGNDKSHITPLVPAFDESGSIVTLSTPDGSPRLTMTKKSSGRG